MGSLSDFNDFSMLDNPLDVVECACSDHGWAAERRGDELNVAAPGAWNNHQLRVHWQRADHSMHILVALDIPAPNGESAPLTRDQQAALYETLSLINERMWMGHFYYCRAGNRLVYRNTTLMDDVHGLSPDVAQLLLNTAVCEAERYYPVLQLVLWSQKSPQEAMTYALFDTVGEA